MRGDHLKPAQCARRFLVSGRVQGVGYRFFVVQAAARQGVSGFVRNQSDGCVEVCASGTAEQLASLRRELETGPRFASVAGVREENYSLDSRYTDDFVIEPDN